MSFSKKNPSISQPKEILPRPASFAGVKHVTLVQDDSVSGRSGSTTSRRGSKDSGSAIVSPRTSVKKPSTDSQSQQDSFPCLKQKRCDCDANLFIQKYKDELEVVFQSKNRASSTDKSFDDDDLGLCDSKFSSAPPSSRRVSFQNDDESVKDKTFPIIRTPGARASKKKVPRERPRRRSSSIDEPSLTFDQIKERLKLLREQETERMKTERLLRDKKSKLDKNKREIEKKLRGSIASVSTIEMQKNLQDLQHAYKMVEKSKIEIEGLKRQDDINRAKLLEEAARIKEEELLASKLSERSSLTVSPSSTLPSLHDTISHLSSKICLSVKELSRAVSKESKDSFLPAIYRSMYGRYDGEEESNYADFLDYRDDSVCKCSEQIRAMFDGRDVDRSSSHSDSAFHYASTQSKDEITVLTPMRQAQDYLKERNVEDLFKFLGSHITAEQPANPIEFLIDLIDQCLEYRNNNCAPPLLFKLRHIESVFKSLDPMGFGEISLDQYNMGLLMLGVKRKFGDPRPKLNPQFMVSKDAFISDAYGLLMVQLDKMIQIPGEPFGPKTKLPSLRSG